MTPLEINKAIAEKIFGFKNVVNVKLMHTSGSQLQGIHPEYNSMRGIPDYCGDIAAAWSVVEKIACEVDGKFQLLRYRDGSWEVGWTHPLDRGTLTISVNADSAPMAICLAALKAVKETDS